MMGSIIGQAHGDAGNVFPEVAVAGLAARETPAQAPIRLLDPSGRHGVPG